jgi:hypothetical protein
MLYQQDISNESILLHTHIKHTYIKVVTRMLVPNTDARATTSPSVIAYLLSLARSGEYGSPTESRRVCTLKFEMYVAAPRL